jgi:phosphoglycolate phosphatase
MTAQLVVGFDLDLTLVDSRLGIAATYRALTARTGVYVDDQAASNRLGPPLDMELALWFPPDEIESASELYRRLYPAHAIEASPALPGAAGALAAVRARRGRIIVITGKYEPNARLHLAHLGLEVDEVVGWAWAEGKVEAMLDHGVGSYVGDHPADMAAAKGAGAAAVGVLTGDYPSDQLERAGADVVLTDLTGFPAWLDRHLDRRETGPAAGDPQMSVGLAGPDR